MQILRLPRGRQHELLLYEMQMRTLSAPEDLLYIKWESMCEAKAGLRLFCLLQLYYLYVITAPTYFSGPSTWI